MGDCVDDYGATIRLIIKDYKILRKIDRKHKLLKLIKRVDDEGFVETEEFNKRYGYHGKSHKTGVGKANAIFGAYFFDLRQEVKNGLTQLLQQEKGKTEDEIWKKMKEKGLDGAVRTHLTHNQVSITNFIQ